MAFRLINATEAKIGNTIIIEGEPCTIKSLDTSKTGKHGHAKVRMEAIGIFDNKKRVIVVPGHERFEIPEINKLKGQILNVQDNKASIMDLESFETIDVFIPSELKDEIKESDSVEYWNVEGKKIIKRKL